jgi:hypothetical protein
LGQPAANEFAAIDRRQKRFNVLGFLWRNGEGGRVMEPGKAAGEREQSHQSIVSITVSGSIIISVSEGWHGTFGGERRSWFAVRRAR